MDLQPLVQAVVTVATIEVEIGVTGDVAGGGRVGARQIRDGQAVVVGQLVDDLHVQIARKALVVVGAVQVQTQGLAGGRQYLGQRRTGAGLPALP